MAIHNHLSPRTTTTTTAAATTTTTTLLLVMCLCMIETSWSAPLNCPFSGVVEAGVLHSPPPSGGAAVNNSARNASWPSLPETASYSTLLAGASPTTPSSGAAAPSPPSTRTAPTTASSTAADSPLSVTSPLWFVASPVSAAKSAASSSTLEKSLIKIIRDLIAKPLPAPPTSSSAGTFTATAGGMLTGAFIIQIPVEQPSAPSQEMAAPEAIKPKESSDVWIKIASFAAGAALGGAISYFWPRPPPGNN